MADPPADQFPVEAKGHGPAHPWVLERWGIAQQGDVADHEGRTLGLPQLIVLGHAIEGQALIFVDGI